MARGLSDGLLRFCNGAWRDNDGDAVDIVEVVLRKDCKYWRDYWVAPDGKSKHGECNMENADGVIVGRWDDDYCSYGERKDND